MSDFKKDVEGLAQYLRGLDNSTDAVMIEGMYAQIEQLTQTNKELTTNNKNYVEWYTACNRERIEAQAKVKELEAQLAESESKNEYLRKHYSDRLSKFALNHERYKFIREEENWSADDDCNPWEILSELNLNEFDSYLDECMEKAGYSFPISPSDLESKMPIADEPVQVDKDATDEIESLVDLIERRMAGFALEYEIEIARIESAKAFIEHTSKDKE